MTFLIQLLTWINVATNALGKFVFAMIAVLPGWLSNTIISVITGIFLMLVFKYTSNQDAIGKVRDLIKANMLALKLFKDSISVTLKAQGQVFKGALLLLFNAIRPMLVMIVPISLLLAQMGLWYQYRPLESQQDEVLVVLQLADDIDSPWPQIEIESPEIVDVTMGPVRIFAKKQVYWKIRAKDIENGYYQMVFNVDDEEYEKQLAIGNGFMRLSFERPSRSFGAILMNPVEEPFTADSVVQSINIDYPDRPSKVSGTNWWIVYFFAASMISAFIFKPLLKVKI